MGTRWAILSEEDREFWSSLGNWTGEAVWQQSGGNFGGGVACLILPPTHNQKSFSLSSPNIIPKPGRPHRLFMRIGVTPWWQTMTFRWTLTDGGQNLSNEYLIEGGSTPTQIDEFIVLPIDFNINSTTLSFTAIKTGHNQVFSMFFDNVHLSFEGRVDHLTVMGV